MNIKNKNKINKSVVVFLASIILFLGFIIFPRAARAAPSISAYDVLTWDTTPLIKGTSTELSDGTIISVNIDGLIYTSTISAGTWSVVFGSALESGYYYDATITASTASDSALVYIDEDCPYEIYFTSEGEEAEFSSITFSEEYSYDSEDGNFSLLFPAGTVVEKKGGGTFDIAEWYAEIVDSNNERIILKLRFGVPDIDLTFSNDVTITFHVGAEYNNQTLNVFSRGDGDNDEGWEPMEEINCNVVAGSCSFNVSEASYFAISEFNSIAETEEGDDDDEDDESEKAHIDSWKAYQYEKPDTDCVQRLKLEIKGKHFDNDAVVRIGDKKAFSVDRKSSKKIVAKFCMSKLLDVKTNLKRTVSVTNPDTEKEKADKKINLNSIGYNMSMEDFNPQTIEGVRNIQKTLILLGFLDQQYITGFYGPLTTSAVMEFQKQNGISQTGYVGPLTKAKLEEKLK